MVKSWECREIICVTPFTLSNSGNQGPRAFNFFEARLPCQRNGRKPPSTSPKQLVDPNILPLTTLNTNADLKGSIKDRRYDCALLIRVKTIISSNFPNFQRRISYKYFMEKEKFIIISEAPPFVSCVR